jgi:hypothetical protein
MATEEAEKTLDTLQESSEPSMTGLDLLIGQLDKLFPL